VAGIEVYALPASLARLGGWGRILAGLALGGLALGGAASALAGLQGLAATEDPARAASWSRRRAALLVLGLGLLACLVPAGSWALLVLTLGVAASALAPAALLAGWSERATPGGVAAGAAVGLVTFLVVALAGLVSPGGPGDEWRMAIATGPATVAVPAHVLVAWILRLRRTAAQRLPPGFGGVAATPPPQAS
jgi:Na+(H+)/acetate symporter ActP